MIYELKDGDLVKILPFIEDDNLVWIKENNIIYQFGNSKLFERNNIIDKLKTNYLKKNVPDNRTLKFSIRYYSNALVNGELKLISFGRKLKEIIDSNNDTMNINSNKNLLIKIKYVNTPAGDLPSYDNCVVVETDIKLESKFIEKLKEFDKYYRFVESMRG